MGLYDSFYDEDSKCPKCHAKVAGGWQTKSLQSVMWSWHRGDILQYTRPETIPEGKRTRGKGGRTAAPTLQRSMEIDDDSLLIFDGKVPVLEICENCKTVLRGYARIYDARFESIVEIETDKKEIRTVIIPERTAESLRDDYERRLSQLQESCKHEKSRWTRREPIPLHPGVKVRVCLKCEKVLERKERKEIDDDDVLRFPVRKGTRNLDMLRQAYSPTGRSSEHLKEALKKGRAEEKKGEQSLERETTPSRLKD